MRFLISFLAALCALPLAGRLAQSDPWPDTLAATEVRTKTWLANDFGTDGTECIDPASTLLVGAGGPVQSVVTCPMPGGATLDGFIFGHWVLPGSFRKIADVVFTMYGVMDTDSGAGTLQGVMYVQCHADTQTLAVAWADPVMMDMVQVAGDVVWDILTSAAATLDMVTCDPNETLHWRYKVCDVSGAPSTGCANSDATAISDLTFLSMTMTWTSNIGD